VFPIICTHGENASIEVVLADFNEYDPAIKRRKQRDIQRHPLNPPREVDKSTFYRAYSKWWGSWGATIAAALERQSQAA
jgi:hypothetical protein